MAIDAIFLAPAKLNLFLHILKRRPDGYHDLQTLFQFINIYDIIRLRIRVDGQIKRVNDILGVPESMDLTVRAAIALKEATGCLFGVEIQVEKHIPMGAGLGGGSSDAATVLLALNHLWELKLNRQELIKIGVKLGADVPVFIHGQNAWAEGIGEILTSIVLPETNYVVLTPNVHVSTAQIFAHPKLTRDTKPLKMSDFSQLANSKLFKNDLQAVVCDMFPVVASALAWLNQFGHAKMSGSGASVFLATESEQAAKEIFAKKPEEIHGFIAKGLNLHPHENLIK